MTVQEQILTFLETIDEWKGRKLTISSHLSSNGRNFDRHFTSSHQQEFIVTQLGARISGARFHFLGEIASFECSLDSMMEFEKKDNGAVFLEKIADTVYRRIELSIQ